MGTRVGVRVGEVDAVRVAVAVGLAVTVGGRLPVSVIVGVRLRVAVLVVVLVGTGCVVVGTGVGVLLALKRDAVAVCVGVDTDDAVAVGVAVTVGLGVGVRVVVAVGCVAVGVRVKASAVPMRTMNSTTGPTFPCASRRRAVTMVSPSGNSKSAATSTQNWARVEGLAKASLPNSFKVQAAAELPTTEKRQAKLLIASVTRCVGS